MTTILIVYLVLLFPAAGIMWEIVEPHNPRYWKDGGGMSPWMVALFIAGAVLWPIWAALYLIYRVWHISRALGDKFNRGI
jgi:hypothetical protein